MVTPKIDPAKIRLYRCMGAKCAPKPGVLGFSFHTTTMDPAPKCPKCARTPNSPKPIYRMVLVHFDAPVDPDEHEHTNVRACDPSQEITSKRRKDGEPDTWQGGTGCISAVSCPACKETQAFKDAVEAAKL